MARLHQAGTLGEKRCLSIQIVGFRARPHLDAEEPNPLDFLRLRDRSLQRFDRGPCRGDCCQCGVYALLRRLLGPPKLLRSGARTCLVAANAA